jgi:pSer/pThr/pTyr-binding forkhead associated (FHA) protein
MAASLIPTEGGSPILLDKPIMLIGRSQDCDIALQVSSKISRRHCCIVQCGERYVLRDLGSMNGVRVNGQRVIEMELKAGDEIAVADAEFTFRVDEARGKRRERHAPEDAADGPPTPDEHSTSRRDVLPDPLADDEEVEGANADKLYDDDRLPEGEVRLSDDSQSEAGFVHV